MVGIGDAAAADAFASCEPYAVTIDSGATGPLFRLAEDTKLREESIPGLTVTVILALLRLPEASVAVTVI